MGRSSKLFQSLAQGVRLFKSPSKEQSTKKQSPPFTKPQKQQCRDRARRGVKGKCLWNLGTSSSRNNHENPAPSPSPPSADTVNIKVVHVEESKASSKDDADVGDSSVETRYPDIDGISSSPEGFPEKDSTELATEFPQEKWVASSMEARLQAYQSPRVLEALIRVQALARGRIVRRQAAFTLQCVLAIVRMQALVRGHLVRMSEDGRLVQRLLLARQEASDGSLHAVRCLKNVEDKRLKSQQAMAQAFSEQLQECVPKQSSMVIDPAASQDNWGWAWLGRWMVARPWESLSSLEGEHTQCMESDVDDGTRSEPKLQDVQKIASHLEVEPDMEDIAQTIGRNASSREIVNESLIELEQNSSPVIEDMASETLEERCVDNWDAEDATTGHKVSTEDNGTLSAMILIQKLQVYSPPALPPTSPPLLVKASAPLAPEEGVLAHGASPTPRDTSVASLSTSALLELPSPAPVSHQSSSAPTMEHTDKDKQLWDPESAYAVQKSHISVDMLMEDTANSLVPRTPSWPAFVVPVTEEFQHTEFIPPPLFQIFDEDNLKIGSGVEDESTRSMIENNKENHTDGEGKGSQVREESTNDVAEAQADGQFLMDGDYVASDATSHKWMSVSNGKRASNTGDMEDREPSVSASLSLPNYMATTQSSKAKIRSPVSAKQKSDSGKLKVDDSSSSVPKRRHPLSALEGKRRQQRYTALHERAGSKRQVALLKDGNTEKSLCSNGGSRGHGHCRQRQISDGFR